EDSVAAEIIALTRLGKTSDVEKLVDSLSVAQRTDPIILLAIVSNPKNSLSKESVSSMARLFPDVMDMNAAAVKTLQEQSGNIAFTSLLYKQGFYFALEEVYKNADEITP